MYKKILAVLLSAVSLFAATSCNTAGAAASVDVLTQKSTPKDKINITVLVKNAFTIDTFERVVEELYPNINLIQIGNHTSDMGIDEYAARLKHGDLTDMVMTWPLDVGKEYWSDRLLNLATLPVSTRYNNKALNDISEGQNGKLYYLPGPSQVRGIIYNRTLFDEHGWEVPSTFKGFIDLCRTIEAKTGIRALQLGLENPEVLDTAFVGFGYAKSFGTPKSVAALSEYNKGIGSFADNFMPALETFETLVDEGVLRASDLNVSYSDREIMLFTRQCAMVEDSVLMARMGGDMTGTKDEFALMPFLNPSEPADWARLYAVCFVGVDKRVKHDSKKYEAVMQLLDYISTPGGQIALAGDTGAMFSNLKDTQPPDVQEIADLVETLNGGRYGVFPTLKNAQGALREGLAGIVNKTLTKEEVVAAVDAQNVSPPAALIPSIIGTASENFTQMDTGNYLTDAMRAFSGTDFALFLDNGKDGRTNHKGVGAKFYKGGLNGTDVKRVLPDLQSDAGELWKVSMTGENLIKTLEYSIPVDNNKVGWFYYFSGIKMEYSPQRDQGSRIRKISDSAGNGIDPAKIYTIAVQDGSVPQRYIIDCEKTGVKISKVLTDSIMNDKTISPKKDNRFVLW